MAIIIMRENTEGEYSQLEHEVCVIATVLSDNSSNWNTGVQWALTFRNEKKQSWGCLMPPTPPVMGGVSWGGASHAPVIPPMLFFFPKNKNYLSNQMHSFFPRTNIAWWHHVPPIMGGIRHHPPFIHHPQQPSPAHHTPPPPTHP